MAHGKRGAPKKILRAIFGDIGISNGQNRAVGEKTECNGKTKTRSGRTGERPHPLKGSRQKNTQSKTKKGGNATIGR